MAVLPEFARRLRVGETLHLAWSGSRDSAGLATMLEAGCDGAVIDWQHGLAHHASVIEALQGARACGKAALVRLGLDDVGEAARFLDWGAAGVIAPMIDSAADVMRYVQALRYAPLGQRSYGPVLAPGAAGVATSREYFSIANEITFFFAMIETRAGLAALDEILAVPGLDGVLVGPNDLSIALTEGAAVDAFHPLVDTALTTIAEATRKAGKIAAAFCPTGARAAELARRGYQITSLPTDQMLLRQATLEALKEARGG